MSSTSLITVLAAFGSNEHAWEEAGADVSEAFTGCSLPAAPGDLDGAAEHIPRRRCECPSHKRDACVRWD